jgi:hypothetical protein
MAGLPPHPAGALKIAQHFSAGNRAHPFLKSRQGRKNLADGHLVFCRPWRDWFSFYAPNPAMNGWAIFKRPFRRELDEN